MPPSVRLKPTGMRPFAAPKRVRKGRRLNLRLRHASPKAGVLEPVFDTLGFTEVARHRSKDVSLYRQGEINFIINEEPKSHAAFFAEEHGPCVCGMAFRVKDAHKAYYRALELGAQWAEDDTDDEEVA